MFKAAAESPFSALDKTKSKKKEQKQATLSTFFSSSQKSRTQRLFSLQKEPVLRRANSDGEVFFGNRHNKRSSRKTKRKGSNIQNSIVIGDEDKTCLDNSEDLKIAATLRNQSQSTRNILLTRSFAGFKDGRMSKSQPIDNGEQERKRARLNFKHSKPLVRHISFRKVGVTGGPDTGVRLSASNTISVKKMDSGAISNDADPDLEITRVAVKRAGNTEEILLHGEEDKNGSTMDILHRKNDNTSSVLNLLNGKKGSTLDKRPKHSHNLHRETHHKHHHSRAAEKRDREDSVRVSKYHIPSSKRRPLPWVVSGALGNPRLRERASQNVKKEIVSGSGGLSPEQTEVLEAVMFGHKNVFFTGSAGTGKSFLLKTMIRRLKMRYGPSAIGVTASTGLAATNIGGTTINRFAGIGLGLENSIRLSNRVRKSRSAADRWKTTKYLVIDEVSMIDATMFTKLNDVAKMVRGIDKPFGGIQLIITGDFFQLPPVSKRSSSGDGADFCFNSDAWRECIDETFLLTKVYRQSGDLELAEMLDSLRLGRLPPYIRQKFKALERPLRYPDGILPTELYPTRDEVERANRNRLNSLSGEPVSFFAKDSYGPEFAPGRRGDGKHPGYLESMLDTLMCAKVLELKEGAQVMYIKNDMEDPSIVNGTIGRIVAFTTSDLWSYYCLQFKEYERLIYQPLLTYASKFVGNREADLDHTLYEELIASNPAALNKVTVLPGLIARAKRQLRRDMLPLAKFTVNTAEGYKLKLVEPMDFANESNPNLVRTQLPIILAWALSIHKSQGQTLSRVKVDLTRVFEKGQVYVALSRCTSTSGLEIVNFDERKVAVRKDVVRFYSKLKKHKARREQEEKMKGEGAVTADRNTKRDGGLFVHD